jgi:hypothetical protein
MDIAISLVRARRDLRRAGLVSRPEGSGRIERAKIGALNRQEQRRRSLMR